MHYYWCNECTSISEMVALPVVQSLVLKTARIYEAVESDLKQSEVRKGIRGLIQRQSEKLCLLTHPKPEKRIRRAK
jgi:hypothetical protein